MIGRESAYVKQKADAKLVDRHIYVYYNIRILHSHAVKLKAFDLDLLKVSLFRKQYGLL